MHHYLAATTVGRLRPVSVDGTSIPRLIGLAIPADRDAPHITNFLCSSRLPSCTFMLPNQPVSTLPVMGPRWYSRPFGRVAIGGLLLLAEYLAVSLAFDARSVAARGGIWTVLGLAGNVGPLLVVGAAAFLLVPRVPENGNSSTISMQRVNAWMLLFHALLATSFAYVTNLAFGGRQAPPGPALMWMLTWTILGATTAASLLVAMLGDWRWMFHSLGRVVAAGGALGLAAWIGRAKKCRHRRRCWC